MIESLPLSSIERKCWNRWLVIQKVEKMSSWMYQLFLFTEINQLLPPKDRVSEYEASLNSHFAPFWFLIEYHVVWRFYVQRTVFPSSLGCLCHLLYPVFLFSIQMTPGTWRVSVAKAAMGCLSTTFCNLSHKCHRFFWGYLCLTSLSSCFLWLHSD